MDYPKRRQTKVFHGIDIYILKCWYKIQAVKHWEIYRKWMKLSEQQL